MASIATGLTHLARRQREEPGEAAFTGNGSSRTGGQADPGLAIVILRMTPGC
jgi:hypothetical protein